MAPPENLDRLLLQIQYPGMPAAESDVTRDWLSARGRDYDQIEFNVHVGEGVDPGEQYDATTRRQAIGLTQKKVDVVAWRAGQATLVEVKIRAGLGAIGQLLGYQHLFALARPREATPRLAIVARYVDADVRSAASAQGIDLYLYSRAWPPAPAA